MTSYANLNDPLLDTDEVFERVNDADVTVAAMNNKEARTVSTELNVFGSNESRSNSEVVFVTNPFTPRRPSLSHEMTGRITRSRSALRRVPLETTPLQQTIRESFTPPGSPLDTASQSSSP